MLAKQKFNHIAILEHLNYMQPKLWVRLSAKGKNNYGYADMIRTVLMYEQSVKEELQEGYDTDEEIKRTKHHCNISQGYEGYVRKVILSHWS